MMAQGSSAAHEPAAHGLELQTETIDSVEAGEPSGYSGCHWHIIACKEVAASLFSLVWLGVSNNHDPWIMMLNYSYVLNNRIKIIYTS